MRLQNSLWLAVGLLLAAGPTNGQDSIYQNTPPQGQAGAPMIPVPEDPAIQRRPQQPPGPPFVVSPEEQQLLDRVLRAWEERNRDLKTFECKFTRWEYDPLWGDPKQARFEDAGQIKYAAPDKGMYRVDGPRPEHWICDGRSIFEFNFQKKELIEYRLPPELQGKAIADGPLPFLFGAQAEKLKQRYYLRLTAPPTANEVRLEARPRFQRDAANFRRADLILQNMLPYALKIHSPNGKNSTSYLFQNIRINERVPLAPLQFFQSDPFHAATPRGWRKIVEPGAAQSGPAPPQMGGQPAAHWR